MVNALSNAVALNHWRESLTDGVWHATMRATVSVQTREAYEVQKAQDGGFGG